jgi:hypothetical protein
MSDDGSFFGRWSERKTAERVAQPPANEENPDQLEVALVKGQDETSDEDLPIPEDLPDVNTLDQNSDYSLFMRKGTPEHLKRLALKKLFHSDPALAVLDGLNDYDEDYSMIGMVAEAISTRYQPGKGMVDPDEEVIAPEEKIAPEEEQANKPDKDKSSETPETSAATDLDETADETNLRRISDIDEDDYLMEGDEKPEV